MTSPRRSNHDDAHDCENENGPSILRPDAPPPLSPSDRDLVRDDHDDDDDEWPAHPHPNDGETRRKRHRVAFVPSAPPPFVATSLLLLLPLVLTVTSASASRVGHNTAAFAPSSPRVVGERTEPLHLALTEEFIKLKSKLNNSSGKQRREGHVNGGNHDNNYDNNSYDGNNNYNNNNFNNYYDSDSEPIKYFGDPNIDINGNGNSDANNEGINLAINGAPNIISTSEKPFTDKLGYSALSTVQSIARAVGSGDYRYGGWREKGEARQTNSGVAWTEYEEVGRGVDDSLKTKEERRQQPLQDGEGEERVSRAEYIDWQRKMLKETRRDILSSDETRVNWRNDKGGRGGTYGGANGGDVGSDSGARVGGMLNGYDVNGSVNGSVNGASGKRDSPSRTADLIAALPSQRRQHQRQHPLQHRNANTKKKKQKRNLLLRLLRSKRGKSETAQEQERMIANAGVEMRLAQQQQQQQRHTMRTAGADGDGRIVVAGGNGLDAAVAVRDAPRIDDKGRSNSQIIIEAGNKNANNNKSSTIPTNLPQQNNNKNNSNNIKKVNKKDSNLITLALTTLEKDMSLLDNLASLQPQLSGTEVSLLIGSVLASGMGPIVFPGTSVTEVLAPAAAAFTASITIGSEYIGKVAVADGKEIAANTIQCAAEAEALLANAERVKAITPLCVGVGATAASLSLLAPTIIEALNIGNSVQFVTELYLFCPLVSVLAAAVANLALEETRGFASRAINVGVRRFAKSGLVGRTWLSSSEQVQKNSKSKTDRWLSFAWSVLPAPIIGSVVGGPGLSTKCIIVAALAAAQSAYFLALSEGVLARATDAVALKARSAAVCDTYANQGSRNAAILPFTSALSAFCAAATAAIVELPFLHTISMAYGPPGEVLVVSFFPMLSSAFAAAAAVSKARCEVDAEAACQAASTLALEYDGGTKGGGKGELGFGFGGWGAWGGEDDDPVIRPFKAVRELIRLAVASGWRSVRVNVVSPLGGVWRRVFMTLRLRKRFGGRRSGGSRRWLDGGDGLA